MPTLPAAPTAAVPASTIALIVWRDVTVAVRSPPGALMLERST